MRRFKTSRVDGYWICNLCGVAVTPTSDEVSEHLEVCKENLSTSHNKSFTVTKDKPSPPKFCPQCMSENTIKFNEIEDRFCKDCKYIYEGKTSSER